jgi:hypothetical protein
MNSGCVVANMTEQAATCPVRIDLEAQLVGTHFYALNRTACQRLFKLHSKRGQAQRIQHRTLAAHVDAHGRVRR